VTSSLGRAFTALPFAVLATAVAAQGPPPSQPPVATDRVAYFETAPSQVDRAIATLKTYRQTAQKAAGVVRVQVVQQIGRPNFFAIVEKWRDGASLQTQLASADNKKLRDELQALLISPFDERLLAAVTAQPANRAAPDQAIYVLTHADAAAKREEVPGMLQALATAARRENGNVVFDATVQPTRTNHFTLIEVWSDQKSYEAHEIAATTKNFRSAFGAVSGALYDERIYKSVN
jgi:quinol monooxygenase YgiN